ncbi:MAG: HTH domain-containing protein [Kiritimatiellae bacterium]|nr:HTH domain-containing protein [Kiritimatiellia bacterium]
MKSHRATGRPRGRPPSLPSDLPEQILRDLESRMDKTTQLVIPDLGNLAKRLNVSRSSIKREITGLRNCGYIELQYIKKRPTNRIYTILYKLKRPVLAQNSPSCGSKIPL